MQGYDRFVALLVAILLAVLVLPAPWNVAAVAIGAAWEVTTALGGLWWSQKHAARVRAETLVGREVEVRTACRPLGQVRVKGEIWPARCDEGAAAGETVRVVGIDGLTLIVESPVPDPESEQNVGAGSLAHYPDVLTPSRRTTSRICDPSTQHPAVDKNLLGGHRADAG